MLRLHLTEAVLDSEDLSIIGDWLRAHDIEVEWMPLRQAIEFDVGYIWYDLYRHYPAGSIVLQNEQPVTRRTLHTCTLSCRMSVPGPLTDYRIEETDDPPRGPDSAYP